jgi:uncharacterized protein DUF3486
MPPKSKIDLLPPEQRQELERLWLGGGFTRKQLHAHLKSLGFGITYANLNSHVRKLKQRMNRYRDAQTLGGGWMKKLVEQPDTHIGRLLLEMLRVVAFRQLSGLRGDKAGQAPRPTEIAVLAKAIKEMEAASSAIDDRETRMIEKLKSEVDQKAEAMKRNGAGARDEVATLERAKQLVRGLL